MRADLATPPSWRIWAERLAFGLAVLAIFYLLRSIWGLFLLAFLLAYLMEPFVIWLQRRGAPRALAILTIFAVTAILFGVLVTVVLPVLMADLQAAAKMIPSYIDQLNALGAKAARVYQRLRLPLNLRAILDRLIMQATGQFERTTGGILSSLLRLLPSSFGLVLVPIIAYYMSRDYRRATGRIYSWLHARARPDLLAKAIAIDRVLRSYLRGQALEMVIMTVILTAGLYVLGVQFALLLGVLAGLLNIIPYFGPLLGAIPAVLLALMHSPWHAGYVILLFAAANQAESSFLVPRLVGGRVGLHPLVVIFVLLAGGKLFGLIGMVLAVPVAAVLKVVLLEPTGTAKATKPDLTSPGASARMDEEPGKSGQTGPEG